jgi:hypothetical protein
MVAFFSGASLESYHHRQPLQVDVTMLIRELVAGIGSCFDNHLIAGTYPETSPADFILSRAKNLCCFPLFSRRLRPFAVLRATPLRDFLMSQNTTLCGTQTIKSA